MTQNPFDALGGGGFDMNALLQQAQQMQEQLQAAQERLNDAQVEGEVGGGAVTVTVSGTGELVGVTIRPGTVDGGSEEDLADLGDMVVAAYRDAKARADALAAEALGPMAGGLDGLAGGLGGGIPGLGGPDADPGQPGGAGRTGF
ncbi:YbaB/EbfC family nucleoid-associated protein [Nocardioides sp. AX2bis]|uniref:YbaB/EbfC family nucleoid-associated protein n=1 Tax=Nocardioides sp. AX2bis TaxID=2653157 RepID=UPI0012F2BBEB|nr:YbaB/EbfC family nucleoid-associated protein [Nocardioides sp. AX2bis]VXC32261.1 Nucleoid-associated protein Noca_0318 [Nocardioides sp. AX2bis]